MEKKYLIGWHYGEAFLRNEVLQGYSWSLLTRRVNHLTNRIRAIEIWLNAHIWGDKPKGLEERIDINYKKLEAFINYRDRIKVILDKKQKTVY